MPLPFDFRQDIASLRAQMMGLEALVAKVMEDHKKLTDRQEIILSRLKWLNERVAKRPSGESS